MSGLDFLDSDEEIEYAKNTPAVKEVQARMQFKVALAEEDDMIRTQYKKYLDDEKVNLAQENRAYGESFIKILISKKTSSILAERENLSVQENENLEEFMKRTEEEMNAARKSQLRLIEVTLELSSDKDNTSIESTYFGDIKKDMGERQASAESNWKNGEKKYEVWYAEYKEKLADVLRDVQSTNIEWMTLPSNLMDLEQEKGAKPFPLYENEADTPVHKDILMEEFDKMRAEFLKQKKSKPTTVAGDTSAQLVNGGASGSSKTTAVPAPPALSSAQCCITTQPAAAGAKKPMAVLADVPVLPNTKHAVGALMPSPMDVPALPTTMLVVAVGEPAIGDGMPFDPAAKAVFGPEHKTYPAVTKAIPAPALPIQKPVVAPAPAPAAMVSKKIPIPRVKALVPIFEVSSSSVSHPTNEEAGGGSKVQETKDNSSDTSVGLEQAEKDVNDLLKFDCTVLSEILEKQFSVISQEKFSLYSFGHNVNTTLMLVHKSLEMTEVHLYRKIVCEKKNNGCCEVLQNLDNDIKKNYIGCIERIKKAFESSESNKINEPFSKTFTDYESMSQKDLDLDIKVSKKPLNLEYFSSFYNGFKENDPFYYNEFAIIVNGVLGVHFEDVGVNITDFKNSGLYCTKEEFMYRIYLIFLIKFAYVFIYDLNLKELNPVADANGQQQMIFKWTHNIHHRAANHFMQSRQFMKKVYGQKKRLERSGTKLDLTLNTDFKKLFEPHGVMREVVLGAVDRKEPPFVPMAGFRL